MGTEAFLQFGIAGVCLFVLFRMYIADRKASQEYIQKISNESAAREERQSKECLERETRLSNRLTTVEDLQRGDLARIANAATDALRISAEAHRMNAEAFSQLTRASGPHPTITTPT